MIAPHPDDEVLGCGGTLLRRKAEGERTGWLTVTAMSVAHGWPEEAVARREGEIRRVAEMFGFDEVYRLDLPPARLDVLPMADLVGVISPVFEAFQPVEVLVPNRSDVHTDHAVVHDAVKACSKWFRYPSVRRVLAYETLSETEFGLGRDGGLRPNYFVNIDGFLERKLEIMSVYGSELGEHPFPRSTEAINALALLRGATAGYPAAEAFELLRERC